MNDLLRRAWDALDTFKQAYPENWNQEDEQVLEDLMKADLKLLGVKLKWVALTDEERKNIMIECESTGDWAWELKAAQAIEAKLKEKNTRQDGDCKHCVNGCPACDARRQSNVLP